MGKVAVVVGRFQVPRLTDGHKHLFGRIKDEYQPDHLIVFVGVCPVKANKKNPLSFNYRADILLDYLNNYFFNITVVPIADVADDKEWYRNLDSLISKTFPNDQIELFGSRDSFIDGYRQYSGKFVSTCFVDPKDVSATQIRKEIAKNDLLSESFAKGVIYAIENQYPKVYPTVDVAVYHSTSQYDPTYVLLGRKPGEDKFRFIGGFVDPNDNSLEEAALREAKEEANVNPQAWTDRISQCEYIASHKIDDWRYRRTGDTIHTTFFAFKLGYGSNVKAGDDIEEIKWFKISELENITLMPVHNDLKVLFINWAKKKGLYATTA